MLIYMITTNFFLRFYKVKTDFEDKRIYDEHTKVYNN